MLRDKRKKLRETFERIVRLYERENPETYKELRKLELDYETKRGQLALYFDSVKVCLCFFYFFYFTFGICGDSVYHHVSSFSECRVSGGRQYPFTRHASRPLQHPHPGHPSSRGSASLHTEEEHLFWVGIIQVNSVCDAAEYHCATEVILYLRVSQ